MQIKLLCTGKTDAPWLQEGVRVYQQRLKHYASFELVELLTKKSWSRLPPEQLMEKEAELILPHMAKSEQVILLDERGRHFRSVAFASFLQQHMNRSVKSLLFVIGGPWGFSNQVYDAAHMQLSISHMTFSHQMIRLLFIEQLYRAMTILRNEAYHNE